MSYAQPKLIKFTITGKPVALKRHRPSARGGYYDPSSKDKKDIWLQIAKYKPKLPFAGDVYIKLIFYMPRPKSFYRSGKYSHLLKESCKDMIYHSVKPDLDNLVKLICDTIQGKERMIHDDSQVCVLQAEKRYGNPRTEVTIQEIP